MMRLAFLKISSILFSCLLIMFIITGCAEHYKVYETVPVVDLPTIQVDLEDQFGQSTGTLGAIEHFANPAEKNNLMIKDLYTHLTWYKLSEPEPPPQRRVTFDNQFGSQICTIGNPLYLLVPTQKNNIGKYDKGKHYKCYEVLFSQSVDREVTLKDQFDEVPELVNVYEPRFFCTPVRKNNEPVSDKNTHMVFYRINQTEIDNKSVTIMNQFSSPGVPPLTLELKLSEMLGVESEKIKVE